MESSEIELHRVLILFHEDNAWYLIEFLPKLQSPGHKYFRLVHILNEFFFHHKRSKGISMTLSRADETLFTYLKDLGLRT